jgi:hypothetical protein
MRLVENVIEEFYSAVADNNGYFIASIHIPLSNVFYVREALHQATGIRYTLDYVEWAMLKENMIEPRHCYQPKEKMSWSEYPLEKVAK